jgi:hypothetical protein
LQKPTIEQQAMDRVQFRKLRTAVVSDPYGLYLWDHSKHSNTLEEHREYVRAYFHYLSDKMRKIALKQGPMDPFLTQLIDTYERENVGAAVQGRGVRPTIPLRDYRKPETQASLKAER